MKEYLYYKYIPLFVPYKFKYLSKIVEDLENKHLVASTIKTFNKYYYIEYIDKLLLFDDSLFKIFFSSNIEKYNNLSNDFLYGKLYIISIEYITYIDKLLFPDFLRGFIFLDYNSNKVSSSIYFVINKELVLNCLNNDK